MANHIAEVAQVLGVAIGESFKIADAFGEWPKYYRFNENVCLEVSDDGVKWKEMDDEVVLECLLLNEARIIKLLWKPTVHDEYHYPIPSNRNLWRCGIWVDNDNKRRSCRGSRENVGDSKGA